MPKVDSLKAVKNVNTPRDCYLDELERRYSKEKLSETFTTFEEYVNEVYAETWYFGKNAYHNRLHLKKVYELGLEHDDTTLILEFLKYSAKTRMPNTFRGHFDTVVNILQKHDVKMLYDLQFIKAIWPNLSRTNRRDWSSIFKILHSELHLEQFKEQREWVSNNLPKKKKVNPHDPVNGAYPDEVFNSFLDKAMGKVVKTYRNSSVNPADQNKFHVYSGSVFEVMSLISSRRHAQISQCKIVDISPYAKDENLLQIIFYKSKSRIGGFRASSEKVPFVFSELFSSVLSDYLKIYHNHIKALCERFGYKKEVPWQNYPLFPRFFSSKESLSLPKIHTNDMHRNLGKYAVRYLEISINRIRHTTITRGMELGLEKEKLAALTGVTLPAVGHYQDLTPQSRRLINEKFSKNSLLKSAFTWNLAEYTEHFGRIIHDEFGVEVGKAHDEVSCNSCSKKLGAPMGCYNCGADQFLPAIEGNHKAQLIKAQAKRLFLETSGATNHQVFEIDTVIKRIEMVIEAVNQFQTKLQKAVTDDK
ncbi:MAG: hypothetical protein HUJ13_03820 [Hydrogenovibrio crunogenus]|uniref:Uncharacterized protein n=1 Tax=Hydrogenovibrio crunogenus (strain DSM 25203 / XCL-2) TaxID=317025 RepID=Q31JJ0_HYDCU|nr:hypothetical protein [Hydrogenovibrio crunogenus]